MGVMAKYWGGKNVNLRFALLIANENRVIYIQRGHNLDFLGRCPWL
jgi:hypothetical protein